jgi:large subunit ribosomal protein L6
MSRIGKKSIIIPEKTEVSVDSSVVLVKGPLGQLDLNIPSAIIVKKENNEIILSIKKESLENRALWGTYTSLIRNMIEGVNAGFQKELIIEGIGYRANVSGSKVVFSLGFSHQVELEIPSDIKITVDKDLINISGIDKQKVGEFAAVIRRHKLPEPYKGKGIRYIDEIIRRKEGKKTA